jgi:hypothetical protein
LIAQGFIGLPVARGRRYLGGPDGGRVGSIVAVRTSLVTECRMPPLIVLALGAVGAVMLGRWFAREARRLSSDMERERAAMEAAEEKVRTLVQDPVTGVYRPK